METPESLAASTTWNRRDEQWSKIYAYYVNALRESGALDFDDLLNEAVRLFRDYPEAREKYAGRFLHHQQDDDRHVRKLGVRLDRGEEVPSGQAGQRQVEGDRVGMQLAGQLDRVGVAGGGHHPVALFGEDALEQLPDGGVVLDHQHG